ncbi:MAG: hypothetical protein NVS2B6_09380 [Thermoleophilaceae bacterium]
MLVTGGERPSAAYLPLAGLEAEEPLLLGMEGESAIFAVALDAVQAERLSPKGARFVSLRDAGGLLGQTDGGLLAYASALATWHARHPHCAVCGSRTDVDDAGHVRRCPRCAAVHQPRTDPVVITLVTDGVRALLGRQPSWPAGRYSALAGFVEPGEALEDAVAREVLEEACVEVTSVRYEASQPWPFPSSLMLGFRADHAGGEAAVGDGELEDVRWFEREEIVAAGADWGSDEGGLALPPPVAIARRLIDRWLAEPAP